jgi:hypothetical protein
MGERIVTIGGNKATRPLSDFGIGNMFGSKWYVNNLKSATGNGQSWTSPFKTITEAVAKAAAGDVIMIHGDGTTVNQYTETVTPLVSGLKFIADNENGVIWGGVTDALILNAVIDTYMWGIRFRPTSGYAGLSMTGASNGTIVDDCRFQGTTGSKYGIKSDGHQSGVKIINGCHFLYMNAATCYGIYAPIDAGVAENASWEVIGNYFHSNVFHLKGNFRYSIFKGNSFAGMGLLATGAQGAPTKCIDFTPGAGSVGNNTVTQNMLGGSYSTALYVSSNADEDWMGNYAYHATTAPNGISIAVPAA